MTSTSRPIDSGRTDSIGRRVMVGNPSAPAAAGPASLDASLEADAAMAVPEYASSADVVAGITVGDIGHGEVFAVPDEGVVGVAYRHIAIAVTEAKPDDIMYHLGPNGPAEFAESWDAAAKIASAQGLKLAPRPVMEPKPPPPEHWVDDMERVGLALEAGGWLQEDHEGNQFLTPDAPAELVSQHKGLVTMGYANGWL